MLGVKRSIAVWLLGIVAVYCAGSLAYRNGLFQDEMGGNIRLLVAAHAPTLDIKEVRASLLLLAEQASSLQGKIEERRTNILERFATASLINSLPSDELACEQIRGAADGLRSRLLTLMPSAVDPSAASTYKSMGCMSALPRVVADITRMASLIH